MKSGIMTTIRPGSPWDLTGRHTPETAMMEEDEGWVAVVGAEAKEEAVIATAGLVCRVLVETAEEAAAEETVEEA